MDLPAPATLCSLPTVSFTFCSSCICRQCFFLCYVLTVSSHLTNCLSINYKHTDKTIKLWKISSRNKYDANAVSSYQNDGVLRFPTRSRSETLSRVNTAQRGESKECDPDSSIATPLHASTKKVYSNAHAYHINSLATNSDGQTFVSSDDLRVNWWNMDCNDTCFSKSLLCIQVYVVFFV